jgi:hypothetical protein
MTKQPQSSYSGEQSVKIYREFLSIALLKSAAVLSVESQKLKITLLIYQPSNWTQPPSSFDTLKNKPEIEQTEPLHT